METSDSEDYYESADEQLEDPDDLKRNKQFSAQANKEKKITNEIPDYGIFRQECWEPGVNYNIITENDSDVDNELGTNVKENVASVGNILQTQKKNTEPDLKSSEPNMNTNVIDKSAPLPQERMCWLPPAIREVNAKRNENISVEQIDVKSTDSENNECLNASLPAQTEKSKPLIEECWEHEKSDNLTQNVNANVKPKLKTNERVVKDESSNMWDDDDWGFNEKEESSRNKSECKITKKVDSEETVILDKKERIVTKKMDTEKSNVSTKKEYKVTKKVDAEETVVDTKESIVTKKIDREKLNVFTKKECNEDTDKSKLEENMWGDDDGWGFDDDSKGATPIKQTKTKAENRQGEDLWSENDNWGMSTKETTSSERPTNISEALDNLSIQNENASAWGSWGNWGISVLSTAANITNTVSQGITNVLETGMGVPDAEQLAREHKAEQDKLKQDMPELDTVHADNNSLSFGLGNIVSGVSTITKLVETTGTKVISGGLDTLETIGKKTMEVLQENDPNFKKKYAFLKIEQDKPVLSQLLREAKEKAEHENDERVRKHNKKKANYETIFDDYQGLVHLEALEMLSKQSEIKLQSVMNKCTSESLIEFQETMEQVKELCELPDDDDEESLDTSQIKEKIESAVGDIKIPISYSKLLDRWDSMEKWTEDVNVDSTNENEIHQYAIETLAELTAISVELFHKSGELLLIKEHRSTADEADSLVQLTSTMTTMLGISATKFSETLNIKASSQGSKEEINSLITNVFLEAANSSRYVQDAFQLLIPLLQVGAV